MKRPSTALFLLCLVSGAVPLGAAVPARNLVERAHWDEYPAYSSCWSYVHPDGREYAVIGAQGGTAIYNVTNLAATYRVGFIPGPSCLWREMKSYGTRIYVVSECTGTNEGLQIISMANPEAPVLSSTYTTNFNRSHTVSVDAARGLLLCNGTRNAAGQATGMRILSLADPANPVEIGWWPGGLVPVSQSLYVHDSVPVGNRLYASSIYSGVQRILDFAVPSSPVEIHGWNYAGAFTHNAWPDASGNRLYVTDEVRGERLKIFDITTPTAPALVHSFTPNSDGIVHNAHVMGSELYLANYSEGVRVLDLSDPTHPAEFAWADTWPGASGGFNGVWEFCPFFPSGIAIASDMESGLYVFEVVRDYGLVTVEVTETGPDTPLAGVEVALLEQGDVRETDADGVLRVAPSPGSHTLRVKEFGFVTFTTTLAVSDGSSQTVDVSLLRLPTVSLDGMVLDRGTGLPLEDAGVDLEDTPLHAHTDSVGGFDLAGVPEDTYRIVARRPGYAPAEIERLVSAPAAEQTFRLWSAPVYDALEAASGWTVGAPGDNASTGIWTRSEPLGTGALYQVLAPAALPVPAPLPRRRPLDPLHEGHETDGAVPGDVQPEFDRTPAPGQYCFVTGQGSLPGSIGEADVDNGITSLTSPVFDASGLGDPTFGYWRWFYSSGLEDDFLIVLLSNNGGTNWTAVDTVGGIHNHWEEATLRVADVIAPTSQMRLRFVAGDAEPGSIVEAAIDDVILYDASSPAVGTPPVGTGSAPLALRLVSANPMRAEARFTVEVPADTDVRVQVVDVRGRLVRSLYRGPVGSGSLNVTWDGRDAAGRPAASGVYLAVARAGDARSTARFLRLR